MSFITFKLKATSDDAQKDNLSIGVSFNSNGVDLLFNSQNKNTKITANDALKIDFSQYCHKPVIKKTKKTKKIIYDEKKNIFVGKYRHKSELDILEFDRILNMVLSGDDVTDKSGQKAKVLFEMKNEIEKKLSGNLSNINRRFFTQELKKIENKINKSIWAIDSYRNEVRDILELYSRKKSIEAKTNLVERFLKASSKYVTYDLYLQHKDHFICIGCRSSLSDQIIESNTNVVCEKCQCINVSRNKVKVENEKSTHYQSKKTKNEETFLGSFTRFLCKQRVDIPNELEIKLDEFFRQKNLNIGVDIKKDPLILDGTKWIKNNTNIELMIEALEDLGYNTMYSHVRYLCVWYWGWKVKDYEHLKEDVIHRYRVTGAIYNKLKDGSSNLKADFHLCKILNTLGVDCKITDFKPIKGNKTLENYENYWKGIVYEIKNNEKYQHHNGKKIDWIFDD